MATQQELDEVYMDMAESIATLSKARRNKVGCVLVTPENVMLASFNGTPSGWDNNCEYEEVTDDPHFEPVTFLVSKPTVIHAELNAILHAARQGVSVKNATLYTTLSCCTACSAMVSQAGVKRVVYKEEYRDSSGINLLREHGIIVEQIKQTYSHLEE